VPRHLIDLIDLENYERKVLVLLLGIDLMKPFPAPLVFEPKFGCIIAQCKVNS
jgi:hypothetical protein